MDTHKNAPLTPRGRDAMVRCGVEGGLSNAAAARQFNTMPKTVAKWVNRFEAEGVDGLRDRSSRPHSSPSQTPLATCAAVEALRRQRRPRKQIAAELKLSTATVSGIRHRSRPAKPRPILRAFSPYEAFGRRPASSHARLQRADVRNPSAKRTYGSRRIARNRPSSAKPSQVMLQQQRCFVIGTMRSSLAFLHRVIHCRPA